MTKKSKEKAVKIRLTVPSFTFEKTNDPNLQRVVDRNGDWRFYFDVKNKVYRPSVNHILGMGYAKSKGFYDYLLSVSKEEAKKKLDLAGEAGTRTHQAIRDLLSGMKVTMTTKYMSESNNRQEALSPGEWDNLIGWENWCNTYQPQTIDFEKAVSSDTSNYAGTFDWFGTILVPEGDKRFSKDLYGQRVLILPDWKSSSGIWPEYAAQTSAYLCAIIEKGLYKKFVDFYRDQGKLFTGVVRIGTRHKTGFEFVVWDIDETANNFKKFNAAQTISSDDHEFKDEVEQIPMEFDIKIPKAKLSKPKKVKVEEKKEIINDESNYQ